jgi:hypothetical protein
MTDAPVIGVGSVGLDIDGLIGGFTSLVEKSNLLPSLGELAPRMRRHELDMIAVGCSMIGDLDFVSKVRSGRFDEATLIAHLQPEVLQAASTELARLETEVTTTKEPGR